MQLTVELVVPVKLFVEARKESAESGVEIIAVDGVDCPSLLCVQNSMSEENLAELDAAWEAALEQQLLALHRRLLRT